MKKAFEAFAKVATSKLAQELYGTVKNGAKEYLHEAFKKPIDEFIKDPREKIVDVTAQILADKFKDEFVKQNDIYKDIAHGADLGPNMGVKDIFKQVISKVQDDNKKAEPSKQTKLMQEMIKDVSESIKKDPDYLKKIANNSVEFDKMADNLLKASLPDEKDFVYHMSSQFYNPGKYTQALNMPSAGKEAVLEDKANTAELNKLANEGILRAQLGLDQESFEKLKKISEQAKTSNNRNNNESPKEVKTEQLKKQHNNEMPSGVKTEPLKKQPKGQER